MVGSLTLVDQAGRTRGKLAMVNDMPMLRLFDQAGNVRAAIVNIGLETPKTGAAENTGPSSVVLFDTKGKVLWRAP